MAIVPGGSGVDTTVTLPGNVVLRAPAGRPGENGRTELYGGSGGGEGLGTYRAVHGAGGQGFYPGRGGSEGGDGGLAPVTGFAYGGKGGPGNAFLGQASPGGPGLVIISW